MKTSFLSVFLFTTLLVLPSATIESSPPPPSFHEYEVSDQIVEKAFLILQTKCNDCHGQKKKNAILTKENMNQFAEKINKQVFIKKKMPKGDEIKLTEEELGVLKNWVDITIPAKK